MLCISRRLCKHCPVVTSGGTMHDIGIGDVVKVTQSDNEHYNKKGVIVTYLKNNLYGVKFADIWGSVIIEAKWLEKTSVANGS